jgi:hypothetical protein
MSMEKTGERTGDGEMVSQTRSRKLGRTYLKRTDTTLDLSQKAKRAKETGGGTESERNL